MTMTRTRKLTLTMKEFSHLVSESLDMAPLPVPLPTTQSFVKSFPVVSEHPPKLRPSSFHRIFARSPPPSPGLHDGDVLAEKPLEDGTETSRKMIAWPFSRSPRKNRPAKDELEDMGTHAELAPEVKDTTGALETRDEAHSMDSITSLAAASMSSLGSLLPAHERLFQVMSRDGFCSDETYSNQNRPSVRADTSSPLTFAEPRSSPTGSGYYRARTRVEGTFGSKSAVSILAVTDASTDDTQSLTEAWCRRRLTQSSGTTATTSSYRDSLSVSGTDGSDDDPTPRASTFGNHTKLTPPAVNEQGSREQPEDVSDIVIPPSNTNSLVNVSSNNSPEKTPRSRTPSPTFLSARYSSGVLFPQSTSPCSSRPQTPISPSDFPLPPTIVAVSPAGSPKQRPRSFSRTLTPPPLPPPTGPLPAVPSSVPPVPPLPPLVSKRSTMKMAPQLPISSSSRIPCSTSTGNSVAAPPSPPGGLRLPSRLSWVNTVRAVLPSPPASPIKASKGLPSSPFSPSTKEERTKKSGSLKRPTSIGVIDAADNGHVRRTKSILLLGSRSKSHASLGVTKRVQIHAEANTDPAPSRKPRRKSSAALLEPPMPLSSASDTALMSSGPELLVPRDRRHSAPLLSTVGPGAIVNADWTLSLPFCTDCPGNQMPPTSPLLDAQGNPVAELEEPREDWTLCMPLRVRPAKAAILPSEESTTEGTVTETTETQEKQLQVHTPTQLPTPSPSPTLPSPPESIRELEPEEPEERPPSRASLGPYAGGLDMDGGRGKRASGWHVYGWFDEVEVREEIRIPLQLFMKRGDSHVVTARRMTHEPSGRNMSQDTTCTSTSSDTEYHSARSSIIG